MQHRLAHRVGRSSQATPAAVDKSMSASHTEFLTTPLREATRHLARLYAAALELPDVGFTDHPDPPDLPKADWDAMFKSFGALPFNYYWEVYDPAIEDSDEPVVGDVADDLADLYSDLIKGLWLLGRGHKMAAVWHWKFTFGCHWGRHAVSALRALHCHGEGERVVAAIRSTVR
jgi:hypothetical protein